MKHTVRIAIVLAIVVAAATVVSSRVPAQAVQDVQSGYWWQGQPAGAPFPPPPNVPANGLWISGNEASPVAIAAVRFHLGADEATPVLTAKVNTEFPPAQVSSAANAGQIVVMACPTTGAWNPAQAGAWSSKPQYNCAGAVTGTASADGTTVSFDLGGVAANGTVDVALVPGTGAAALPQLPVPGAPPTPQPSGFDLTLQPVTADQIHTSPAAASTADAGTSTGAADTGTAPSTDLGATPSDLGSVGGSSAPPFNYAASAVQPSSGTAAASTAPVAPASLTPQARFSNASIKDNKGYRALAVIVLGALLWWAFRQAVPPRRHRRTIYDGPAPHAA